MGKVPEYNLKAINKYNAKFDRIAVNLPKGTKEIIKELTGKSCNAYISDLVIKDIERIKKEQSSTEQVQNEPQDTESAIKQTENKTIIEPTKIENKADNNEPDECPF